MIFSVLWKVYGRSLNHTGKENKLVDIVQIIYIKNKLATDSPPCLMVFTETVTLNASELDETHKRKRKEDNLNCLQDSIPLRIASLFLHHNLTPIVLFLFFIYIFKL